jgi:hypothetical protein
MAPPEERPWPQRRGLETTDQNVHVILVRSPVERLAKELATNAMTWDREVLGKTIRTAANMGWVFALTGHAWSIFLNDDPSLVTSGPALSRNLHAPAIDFICSDTAGSLGYTYYENGEKLEELYRIDNKVTFESKRRKTKVTSPSAVYRATDDFFRGLDAYEPGFWPDYFFSDGRTSVPVPAGVHRKVGNPGVVTVGADGVGRVSRPSFERVDYLTFKGQKRRNPFGG